jgi:hypothetical protein
MIIIRNPAFCFAYHKPEIRATLMHTNVQNYQCLIFKVLFFASWYSKRSPPYFDKTIFEIYRG